MEGAQADALDTTARRVDAFVDTGRGIRRGDDYGVADTASPDVVLGEDCDDGVFVDDLPVGPDQDDSIAVTVVGDSDIG